MALAVTARRDARACGSPACLDRARSLRPRDLPLHRGARHPAAPPGIAPHARTGDRDRSARATRDRTGRPREPRHGECSARPRRPVGRIRTRSSAWSILAWLTSLPNAFTAFRLGLAGRGDALVSETLHSNSINMVGGLVIPALFVTITGVSAAGLALLFGLTALTLAPLALGQPRPPGRCCDRPRLRRRRG